MFWIKDLPFEYIGDHSRVFLFFSGDNLVHVSEWKLCPFEYLTDQSELTSQDDFFFFNPLVHLPKTKKLRWRVQMWVKGRGCEDGLKRSWWKEKHSWHSWHVMFGKAATRLSAGCFRSIVDSPSPSLLSTIGNWTICFQIPIEVLEIEQMFAPKVRIPQAFQYRGLLS